MKEVTEKLKKQRETEKLKREENATHSSNLAL
jgi:hypothetical protein